MVDVVPLTEDQNHLIETHLRLAQSIAAKFWKRATHRLELDEVTAVAYQGLVTAAIKFDPEYRPGEDPNYDPFLAFGPFARTRITGAVQDWLRTLDHVPRRQRALYKDFQARVPSMDADEIASVTGIDVTKVRAITTAVENPPVPLDTHAAPPDSRHVEAAVVANTIQSAVSRLIEEMPPLKKSVVVLRYYLGYDFGRISAELGVGLSVVKTVHQEAILDIHLVMVNSATV